MLSDTTTAPYRSLGWTSFSVGSAIGVQTTLSATATATGRLGKKGKRLTVEQKHVNPIREVCLQSLPQIPLAEINHATDGLPALGPMLARLRGLGGLVFRRDHRPFAGARGRGGDKVIRHRKREVDGAHAVGGARFDDGGCVEGAGQLVDEVALVLLEGDEFIAHEGVEGVGGRGGVDCSRDGGFLGGGFGVEAVQDGEDVRRVGLEGVGHFDGSDVISVIDVIQQWNE